MPWDDYVRSRVPKQGDGERGVAMQIFVRARRHAGAKVLRWRVQPKQCSQAGTRFQNAEVRPLGFNECRICLDGGQFCTYVAFVRG